MIEPEAPEKLGIGLVLPRGARLPTLCDAASAGELLGALQQETLLALGLLLLLEREREREREKEREGRNIAIPPSSGRGAT